MRAKRSKQYRKLMSQYALTFGFREPYQVLIDAEMMQDTERFKMDLVLMLEHTLHGKVKPMITQCCIRHLYTATPKSDAIIDLAKRFERRRCNHHLLDQPLSALECLTSVVDAKATKVNKHKYIIASQDERLRATMRQIPGVPLIYVKKSVMILEPMAGATEDLRSREERAKFKAGVSRNRGGATAAVLGKRERDDGEEVGVEKGDQEGDQGRTKRKKRGPKGPNPLSVKRPKPRAVSLASPNGEMNHDGHANDGTKKKRRRKHKSKIEGEAETTPTDGASEG